MEAGRKGGERRGGKGGRRGERMGGNRREVERRGEGRKGVRKDERRVINREENKLNPRREHAHTILAALEVWVSFQYVSWSTPIPPHVSWMNARQGSAGE